MDATEVLFAQHERRRGPFGGEEVEGPERRVVYRIATEGDDLEFDGAVSVTVTATVTGWTTGISSMSIEDSDIQEFIITVPARSVEGYGMLPDSGNVSITGILASDLTVGRTKSGGTS